MSDNNAPTGRREADKNRRHKDNAIYPEDLSTLQVESNPHNEGYLATKKEKMGHDL